MRLALRTAPATRLPRVPAIALVGIALWAGFALLGLALGDGAGGGFVLCQFKRVTGRPCLSCGSSRGVAAALHGEFLDALAWNPLVMSALALLATVLLSRALTARKLVLDTDSSARWLLFALGLAALFANWWWVWDRA
jgi:hypothetical protein